MCEGFQACVATEFIRLNESTREGDLSTLDISSNNLRLVYCCLRSSCLTRAFLYILSFIPLVGSQNAVCEMNICLLQIQVILDSQNACFFRSLPRLGILWEKTHLVCPKFMRKTRPPSIRWSSSSSNGHILFNKYGKVTLRNPHNFGLV